MIAFDEYCLPASANTQVYPFETSPTYQLYRNNSLVGVRFFENGELLEDTGIFLLLLLQILP